jgi:E3 ubiquitin-protein ligase NEDD4
MDFVSYSAGIRGGSRFLTIYRDNDIEGVLELTFSVDDEKFGERRTIDLKPGGRDIPVTNENKAEYVE